MGLNRIRILYLGDADLARECLGRPGGSMEIFEVNPPSNVPPDLSSYDIAFVEYPCHGADTAAVFRDIAARGPKLPVVLVADWNEKLAVAALKFGAADYVIKSQPSFRAVYFRLHRYLAQASAAAELAASKTQLDEAQAAASKATAALQLAEERAERARHDASIEKEIGAQKIMQLVAKAEAARQEASESRAQFEAFERKIADGNAALERANHLHSKEANEAAARHAELVRKLAETAATLARVQEDAAAAQTAATERRNQIETELATVNETLERTKQHHAAEIREATSRHEDAQRELAAAASTLEQVRQNAAQEEAAATERRNQIEAELSREQADRDALAKQLAGVTETLERAREQHAAEIREATHRHEDARQNAAREQAAAADRIAQLGQALADLQASGLALEERLADVTNELARTQEEAAAERAAATERRERLEHELSRECETREALADQLAETTTAFENMRQQSAVEREEASQLYGQIVSDLAKETSSREALQQRHTVEIAEADSRRAQLEKALADSGTALEVTKGELDSETANRKRLEEQLSHTRAELERAKSQLAEQHATIEQLDRDSRVRFGRTPVSSARCRPDGTLMHVNNALAVLLGYDSVEDLQTVDFAGDVLESGDELKRLATRCMSSRSLETFETTLRKKDGMRIIVQILGVAAIRDAVDLTVIDMMPIRVLEERLRSSQRMEAVARYGSEVAATCHNLLSHVKEEGQHWLERISSDSARQQGELLLDDVTRAEGFLRQLEAYGLEQKSIPERVEVKEVLRDLEPVLKRVAGGDVKIVLPKSSAPLNVDIDGERVERMLVNIAAFGRDRIQEGGQLSIKVAAVDLDRAFAVKYPSVRPGPHVLITVAKIGKPGTNVRTNNPGIDLGALQARVTEGGGHLWMMTEPPGDMILKIHLPRRPLSFVATSAGWISHALGARN